jgi:hypothetical protein
MHRPAVVARRDQRSDAASLNMRRISDDGVDSPAWSTGGINERRRPWGHAVDAEERRHAVHDDSGRMFAGV